MVFWAIRFDLAELLSDAVACRSKKRNAELVFFVRCAMFLHFGITITQPNANFLKNFASDFE